MFEFAPYAITDDYFSLFSVYSNIYIDFKSKIKIKSNVSESFESRVLDAFE